MHHRAIKGDDDNALARVAATGHDINGSGPTSPNLGMERDSMKSSYNSADPILCMMRIVPYCHPVLVTIYGFELHKIIVHCTGYRYIPILCSGSKSFNSEALFLGNILG